MTQTFNTIHIAPITENEVINTIISANENGKSIHCYSAGFNWGYGANNSIDKEAVSIDLSKMNKIISFDVDLGILKMQPGVTQGQLLDYLKTNNHEYYVPNTGAGSRGSILGNALERGFGIAPIHDHASSILSVRGILGDGSVYESALKEIDPLLADCFPWGVGPQLDKMISQSSWIVITEVSIQLKKRHPKNDVVIISFSNDEFKNVINCLRELLSIDDGNIGSIKIFNRNQILTENMKSDNSNYFKNNEWFMSLIIYSHAETRKGLIALTKKVMKKYTSEPIRILNLRKVNFLINLLSKIPLKVIKHNLRKLSDLKELMNLANGEVSEAGFRALNINYNYTSGKLFEISKFNQELVWLSPICPLEPGKAEGLLKLIQKLNTHPDFKFNTYTWTILNQRTLALVIPILFDKDKKDEFFKWYEDIHLELKKEGYIPYRFHISMMNMVREKLLPNYFKHVEKFEKAFDPKNTILKDRY